MGRPPSPALQIERGEPVSVAITCSSMCWKQIGKLAEYEMTERGWNKAHVCAMALHPVTDRPMSHSTLAKFFAGDYSRGGPFIATLVRIFLGAFTSSGYELVLRAGQTGELRKPASAPKRRRRKKTA